LLLLLLLLLLRGRLLLPLLRLLLFHINICCRRGGAPQCLLQVLPQLCRGRGATDLIRLTPSSCGQAVPLAAPLCTTALLLLLLLLPPVHGISHVVMWALGAATCQGTGAARGCGFSWLQLLPVLLMLRLRAQRRPFQVCLPLALHPALQEEDGWGHAEEQSGDTHCGHAAKLTATQCATLVCQRLPRIISTWLPASAACPAQPRPPAPCWVQST
jgi:hypothetical protein